MWLTGLGRFLKLFYCKYMSETYRGEFEQKKVNVENFLEAITYEHEGAPNLEVSNFSEKELQRLFSAIKENKNSIVAVIRCWNKTTEQLSEVFERLKDLQKSIPQLRGAFISINDDNDKDHQTSKNVEELSVNEDLPIVPLKVKGYTWTSGLNGPVALLNQFCEQEGIDSNKQQVFNLSFDSIFSEEEAKKIAEKIRNGEPVISMRSEGESLDEKSARKTSEVIKRLIKKGVDVDGGVDEVVQDNESVAFMARNTGMVWSLHDLARLGGFNKERNKAGGMEDHEFGVRLLLDALQTKQFGKAKKLLKAMKENPIIYTDLAWQKIDEAGRKKKISNELVAIVQIVSDLTAVGKLPNDSKKWIVKEENRDFKL